MLQFSVDSSLCTRCGLCAQDCVSQIVEQEGSAVPSIAAEKEALCLKCQHCLAVCPTGAISIFGKLPADSQPLFDGSFPSYEQMAHFLRGRRSIRHYQNRNVDPALIQSILTTLAHVQTGVNACELTFNVIDDIQVMKQFEKKTIAAIRESAIPGEIPERYTYALDLPDDAIAQMLFRSAPHALIVSAPTTAPCPNEDVALAIANFELLAQSAGLGSVWWGLLRLFSTIVPKVRQLLGLPDDHVFAAALFGYPDIRFARTVQKDDAAIVRRISM